MFVWPTKSKGLQVGAADEATWDRYTMSSLLSQGRVGVWGGCEFQWQYFLFILSFFQWGFMERKHTDNILYQRPLNLYQFKHKQSSPAIHSFHIMTRQLLQLLPSNYLTGIPDNWTFKKRNGELVHSLWEHHPEVLHATFTCIHLAKLSPTVISTD